MIDVRTLVSFFLDVDSAFSSSRGSVPDAAVCFEAPSFPEVSSFIGVSSFLEVSSFGEVLWFPEVSSIPAESPVWPSWDSPGVRWSVSPSIKVFWWRISTSSGFFLIRQCHWLWLPRQLHVQGGHGQGLQIVRAWARWCIGCTSDMIHVAMLI